MFLELLGYNMMIFYETFTLKTPPGLE